MKFNRLYIEEGVMDEVEPLMGLLYGHVKNNNPIVIRHYKDVFSRANQDLGLQKRAPSLILASKAPPFLFKGSRHCQVQDGLHSTQYYALPIMNCTMECDYCFLRGMYPTGNVVYFVNHSEALTVLKDTLHHEGVGELAISYESDLLAMDHVLHCLDPWLDIAQEVPGTQFEVRTKAGKGILKRLEMLTPLTNVILSWTMSPPEVACVFERGAPSFASRLGAMKSAIEKGWRVRACIDPILFVDNWEGAYGHMISDMFSQIDARGVEEVHIGVFRMGKRHLKVARKRYPHSPLLHYPYELRHHTFTYPADVEEMLLQGVRDMLREYLPEAKIRRSGGG